MTTWVYKYDDRGAFVSKREKKRWRYIPPRKVEPKPLGTGYRRTTVDDVLKRRDRS